MAQMEIPILPQALPSQSLGNFYHRYVARILTPCFSSIVGPAVGGALGGVALISIIIFTLFYMLRRTRRREAVDIDPVPNVAMSESDANRTNGVRASRLSSSHDMPASFAADAPLIPPTDQSPPLPPPKTTASPQPHSASAAPVASSSSIPPTVGTTSPFIGTLPSTNHPTENHLTPAEAQFLHGLYSRGIPPGEIADMMNVMRERREGSSRPRASSHRVPASEPESDPSPPVYDFTN